MQENQVIACWNFPFPILGRIFVQIDKSRTIRWDRVAERLGGEYHLIAGPLEIYLTPKSVLRQ